MISKDELLEDYCQRCGATVGSFDCCQSELNKRLRKWAKEDIERHNRPIYKEISRLSVRLLLAEECGWCNWPYHIDILKDNIRILENTLR